jgi:hypothetical protein
MAAFRSASERARLAILKKARAHAAAAAASWTVEEIPTADRAVFMGQQAARWMCKTVAKRERWGEARAQCGLIHDIFGNPFRSVSLAAPWLTPVVLKLAQAAYDNRLLPSGLLDNTGLAILADALEEAGCTDPDILSHLRGPGPHVRGCWPVDLILGKE